MLAGYTLFNDNRCHGTQLVLKIPDGTITQ